MNAKQFFAGMNDEALRLWVLQYGEAAQAAFYRTVPRRKAWAEMRRRGLKPLPLIRAARPNGYDATVGRVVAGYLVNQGLMV